MSRLAVVILVLLAALAAASAADAKEVRRVTACGANGCADVPAGARTEALLEMGATAAGPSAGGPGFVRLRVLMGDGAGGARIDELYVPARNLAASRDDRGNWTWWTPGRQVARALRRATAGTRPLPAARLPRTAVRTATGPPAPATASAGAGGDGTPAWVWAAIAAAVVLVAGGGRAALRSPRRRS